MYCHHCGKEIESGDKFCAFCGTSVSDSLPDAEVQANAETQPCTQARTDAEAETDGNTTQANEAIVDDAAKPDAARSDLEDAAEASTGDEAGTLKAAVAATRKRARRKIPPILLIALALALATSVAYAVYQVYTQVWVPYQAQQQTAQSDSNDTTAASEYVDVWVVDTETRTIIATETGTHEGEISYQSTSFYDETGKLIEQSMSTFGSVPDTAVQTYEYDDLLPISIVHETQTVAGTEYHGANKITIEYGEQNRCTSVSDFIIQEGDGGMRQSFSYDDLGRISSVSSEWISGDETIGKEALQVSYDADDSEGLNPHFSPSQGSSFSQDSELSASTLRLVYEDAQYDEYGNLTAVTSTDSSATSAHIEYTYKLITVKRDEWLPNPWSNPTIGAGDLSNYGTEFTYYSLRPERIEEIMTANE